MKISTVEQMRQMDRTAVEQYGIPDIVLMENAGNAAFFVLRNEIGIKGRRFVVVSGTGNNGGDGFVIARKLFSSGADVHVFVLGNPTKMKGSGRTNFDILKSSGASITEDPSLPELNDALRGCDGVVDAIFGTGLARDVGGKYAQVIEAINACPAPVLSVDIPSGVEGNTGRILGTAVRADHTVTFGLPKRGNLLYPGAEMCGQLFVSHISFPPKLQNNPELRDYLNVPAPLPNRQPNGHKGSFGDALFIAGARNYLGAPGFAGLAMLRAGGGYARLATPKSVVPTIASFARELVFLPQPETDAGTLPLSALDSLVHRGNQQDVVAVGPGLGLHETTQNLVRSLVESLEVPLLIDGDGLTAVAGDLEVLGQRTAPTILTPHPGEMARLTGKPVSNLLAAPFDSARSFAVDNRCIVVLKGAHTIIATPEGHTYLNPTGNSGMGTAGSGDVLVGTIAAMLGLGLSPEDATKTGVFIHGLAGDLAAEALGEDGLTARDILDHLPEAMRTYREQRDELIADCYGLVQVI